MNNYDYIDENHPDVNWIMVLDTNGISIMDVQSLWVKDAKIVFRDGTEVFEDYDIIDIRSMNVVAKARRYSDKCECGAYTTHKIGKGQLGHSNWCGWKVRE